MKFFRALLFIITTLSGQTLQANDSAASIGAGGIQFHKTPGIVMEKEELFISPDQVNVSYVFKNVTKRDITVDVFFPLPPQTEITAQPTWDSEILNEMVEQEKRNHPDRPVTQASTDAPFNDFSVTVDGQKVAYKTEIRVLNGRKDITYLFQKYKLPLSPVLATCNYPIESEQDNKACGERIKQYERLSLLSPTGQPIWKKQVHYYWSQTFPKGKEVKIEHSYRPVRGSFFIQADLHNRPLIEVLIEQLLFHAGRFEQICLGQSTGIKENFVPWVIREFQEASQKKNAVIMFYEVDYILTTGMNWEGPICDFTLTIEYPKGGTIASCWALSQKNMKDLGNNRIQFHQKDFTPDQDLKVLFGVPFSGSM